MHELSIAHAVVRTVVDALPDPSVKVTPSDCASARCQASYRRPFTSHTTSRPRVYRARGSVLEIQNMPVVVNCPPAVDPGTVGYP